MAVANNFWGKDDAGVQPLLERMHNAKVTCDELKAFYNGEHSLAATLGNESNCFQLARPSKTSMHANCWLYVANRWAPQKQARCVPPSM